MSGDTRGGWVCFLCLIIDKKVCADGDMLQLNFVNPYVLLARCPKYKAIIYV